MLKVKLDFAEFGAAVAQLVTEPYKNWQKDSKKPSKTANWKSGFLKNSISKNS